MPIPRAASPLLVVLDTSGVFHQVAAKTIIGLAVSARESQEPGSVFFDAYDPVEGESSLQSLDLLSAEQCLETQVENFLFDGGGQDLPLAMLRSFQEAERLGWLDGSPQAIGDWILCSDFYEQSPTDRLRAYESSPIGAERLMIDRFKKAPRVYALCMDDDEALESAAQWASVVQAWRGAPVIAMGVLDYQRQRKSAFEAGAIAGSLAPSRASPKPRAL